MGKKLAYHVTVPTEDGSYKTYGPDDDLPADVAKKITNPSAWEGGAAPVQAAAASSPPSDVPPRGGQGSGRDAWAAYAASKGVDVPAEASRDDIVAACEKAGVPTEPPGADG